MSNAALAKPDWQEIRNTIMQKYAQYVRDLSVLTPSTKKKHLASPRVAVVISLWEKDAEGLTGKMFAHTLQALVTQAIQSKILLDVFMVANNSGGPSDAIAAHLEQSIIGTLNGLAKQFSHSPIKLSYTFDTSQPEMLKGCRFFYLKQARSAANKGKYQALRDASQELYTQVVKNNYRPDIVMQNDAESKLEFSEWATASERKSGRTPLQILVESVLYAESHVLGKCSSDRYERIDADGNPTTEPRPMPYTAFYLEKYYHQDDRLLSGGGMVCRPAVYIAGMKALTEVVPSIYNEDVALSKLILEQAYIDEQKGAPFVSHDQLIGVVNSVTHLNKIPAGTGYLAQVRMWIEGRRGVEQIFPERDPARNREGLSRGLRFFSLVLGDRVEHILKGDFRYILQMARDIFELPLFLHTLITAKTEALMIKRS